MEIKTTNNREKANARSGYASGQEPVPAPAGAKKGKSRGVEPPVRVPACAREAGACRRSWPCCLSPLGVFTFTSGRLSLRDVTIQGCNRADAQKDSRRSCATISPPTCSGSIYRMRARLEQETWVRRSRYGVCFPPDLVMYVEERIPSVVLELQGELMIADDDGHPARQV